MGYDEDYSGAPALFGPDPEPVLMRHIGDLDRALPVLDVGAGQGRNTIPLARLGFLVDAIDPSAVAVQTLVEASRTEDLPVTAHHSTVEHFPGAGPYGGILVFGLIQILTWEGIEHLVRRITAWSASGSLVFITAFSVSDPLVARWKRRGHEIGPNSFTDDTGDVRTFLEPGQILEIFHAFDVVEHREGPGPLHSHGDGPPERHEMVEAVLRRPGP